MLWEHQLKGVEKIMAVTPNDAIEERRREIQKKRKAQRAKRRKAALKRFLVFLCIVAVITLAVLSLTVFFPVERIIVEAENSIYSSEQIIKASGIKKGENLWMTGLNAEDEIPTKLPFVAGAEVKRKFPSSIIIKTTPAKPAYNVMVGTDYYVCDSNYKVLEITKDPDANVLLITGAEPKKVKAGNVITFANEKKQGLLENIFSLLKSKNIKANFLDVTELMEIKLRVENRFDVELGSSAYLDLKIAHLAGMLKEVDSDIEGSIDLSEYTPENGRGILTRE